MVLAPFESAQDTKPGPYVPSAQENDVDTDWPTAYVPPDAGETISADGAPTA